MATQCPICAEEIAAEDLPTHLTSAHQNSVTRDIAEMRAETAGRLDCPICHERIGSAEQVSRHIQERHRM